MLEDVLYTLDTLTYKATQIEQHLKLKLMRKKTLCEKSLKTLTCSYFISLKLVSFVYGFFLREGRDV